MKVVRLLVILSISMAGCLHDDNDVEPQFATTVEVYDAAGAERSTFLSGETITIIVSIKNLTTEPQTIVLNDGKRYEIIVNWAGQSVTFWNGSTGYVFTQGTEYLVFNSRETKTFRVTWDQVGNNGQPAGPGFYEVQGYISTILEDQRSSKGIFFPGELRSTFKAIVIQ